MDKSTPKILVSFYFSVLLIICTLLLPSAALAGRGGQIKILDDKGLTRAFARVAGPAEVSVKAKNISAGTRLLLRNIDGLEPAVSSQAAGRGILKFKGVAPGTWRIDGSGTKAVIIEVKILAGK